MVHSEWEQLNLQSTPGFLAWKRKKTQLPKHVLLVTIRWWTKSKKKSVSDSISRGMFSLFNFWTLKMGPRGCHKTSVRNYYSTLHNIPEECGYHMMIWWCRPWFGSAWSGSEHFVYLRPPHVFKCQISVKNLVMHSNKCNILSFENHFLEHGHCRPKHVGEMSHIYKLLSFYCCAVGTNIAKPFI